MYFASEISFDPTAATRLDRVKPTKAFARLFYYMTAGLAREEVEVETFTAVSILQQINVALRSAEVTNIVRLACDGDDFYHDREGRPDDLAVALQTLEASRANADRTAPFETLALVLEHAAGELKYLIQIDIVREHAPGTHPIRLTVNGVPRLLQHADDAASAKRDLVSLFSSQQAHDAFVDASREEFDAFLDRLVQALALHIGVDQVTEQRAAKLLRPERRRKHAADDTQPSRDGFDDAPPLFCGYYGFTDSIFHMWLWSELMHDHGIQARDVTLVNEAGADVVHVGEDGIDPGEVALLDPDAPLAVAAGVDAVGLDQDGNAIPKDTGGWLGSVLDGGVDTDGGFDSGSSCSSCGSCGGD